MREVQTCRASSWSELQDLLFADTWDPHIRRYRSAHVFRGLSDASYQLSSSLTRLQGPYAEMEGHLLRNFRKYAHGGVVGSNSVWHWLALAQHHGLPTRLIDWTFSPFVAMHFATSNLQKVGVDGVIWAVEHESVHQHLPTLLSQELKDEGSSVFTVDMLAKHAQSLRDFDALCGELFVLFLEPPAMDERIINQYALFSCPSTARLNLSEHLNERPELYRKIVIPANLKWEVRDKLDQANITERVLFPGLDGLSRWLARSYSFRDESPAATPAEVEHLS